jgi:hypothetical protein
VDRQFLEFWGNVLLTAAKGQKQLEELAPWMRGMRADSSKWESLFRNIYGIDAEKTGSAAWDKAMQQFQSSLKEWLTLLDVVPRGDVEALQKKNQVLEQKILDQKTTIQQLQQLLNEKGIPSSKAMLDFSDLMQKQSQQFQDLMGSMAGAFKSDIDDAPND